MLTPEQDNPRQTTEVVFIFKAFNSRSRPFRAALAGFGLVGLVSLPGCVQGPDITPTFTVVSKPIDSNQAVVECSTQLSWNSQKDGPLPKQIESQSFDTADCPTGPLITRKSDDNLNSRDSTQVRSASEPNP
jgi:hypothetical protein